MSEAINTSINKERYVRKVLGVLIILLGLLEKKTKVGKR